MVLCTRFGPNAVVVPGWPKRFARCWLKLLMHSLACATCDFSISSLGNLLSFSLPICNMRIMHCFQGRKDYTQHYYNSGLGLCGNCTHSSASPFSRAGEQWHQMGLKVGLHPWIDAPYKHSVVQVRKGMTSSQTWKSGSPPCILAIVFSTKHAPCFFGAELSWRTLSIHLI